MRWPALPRLPEYHPRLALWDSHDPLKQLEAMGGFTCERRTVFFGNFQIISATKDHAA